MFIEEQVGLCYVCLILLSYARLEKYISDMFPYLRLQVLTLSVKLHVRIVVQYLEKAPYVRFQLEKQKRV